MDFKELINSLSKINEQIREQSQHAVNTSLTLRNWFLGFYIAAFEQNGKDRAGYGKALLANIAANNQIRGLAKPGYSVKQQPLILKTKR